eukprot:TRINITY_DN603_c0_g1_i1.p1 TRINITY_DN603_c0_g1~~TRINITY_DN603_c0_g1_i1.p1  ORF type:complete len:438 (+),score=127.91 TRINITY_DN603_c0_g1_i1:1-1314(+)
MKSVIFFIVVLFLSIQLINAYTVSYNGHSVLRCNTTNKQMYQDFLQYADEHNLDVWKRHEGDGSFDINLSSNDKISMQKRLKGFDCINWIEDLQKAIDEETNRNANAKATADSFFNNYQAYDDILAFLKSLALKHSFMYLVNIGNSTEGRQMWAVEMNGGQGLKKKDGNMPHIYFQAHQHAREWISSATLAYIVYSLAEGYGTNPTVTRIVDEIYWHMVVVVNPDGLMYSRTNDRMWRKNRRSPPAGSTCYGVDTNRNWPSFWNKGGSSTNPCSDTYMGQSAASEVEVQNVIRYWRSIPNLVVSTDYHSYSQIYMTPWGYTTTPPPQPDYSLQTEMGNKYAAALKLIDGKTYRVEIGAKTGLISGAFDDFGYDNGALYSQTLELRDTGRYGFLLPVEEIVPTGQENFNGVLSQATAVLENVPLLLALKNKNELVNKK